MNTNNHNAHCSRRRRRGGQGLTKKIRREIEERRKRMRMSQCNNHTHDHRSYPHTKKDNRANHYVGNYNSYSNRNKRQPHRKEEYMRKPQCNRYKNFNHHWKQRKFYSRSNISTRRNNGDYIKPRHRKYMQSSLTYDSSYHQTKPFNFSRSNVRGMYVRNEQHNSTYNTDCRDDINTIRTKTSIDLLNITQIETFDLEG